MDIVLKIPSQYEKIGKEKIWKIAQSRFFDFLFQIELENDLQEAKQTEDARFVNL